MTEADSNSVESKKHQDSIGDEIEFIDLLRILWKWKYMIIIGTAVCALSAMIINVSTQPIYLASMVLKSGLNKSNYDGTPIYRDSVQEFRSKIEGELIRELSSSASFKYLADNNTNTLKVFYETADREKGVEILNSLLTLLINKYQSRVRQLQDEFDFERSTTKRQLTFRMDEENFIKSNLQDLQKQLDGYSGDSGTLKDAENPDAKSQKHLLTYSSIVKNIANLKRKLAQARLQIDYLQNEIVELEKAKPGDKAVLVAQSPFSSQAPIKPKKLRNLILAIFAGLFFMMFVTFLIEYISRHKD